MSARFFLDTNIFVYLFDTSQQEKSDRALQLVRDAVASKHGIVSYQVVQEFFNVALTRFAKLLPITEIERYLLEVFRPILAVHSSPRLFLEALWICSQHQFSWYDSLIVAAAQQAECSVLYTEDMQDGRRIGDLRIENPFR
jgi:predicted nucleic acid-binding protein